jgi:hypothetical protein
VGRTRTHTGVKIALMGAHSMCPTAAVTRERVLWDFGSAPNVDTTKFLVTPKPASELTAKGSVKLGKTVADILAVINNNTYAVDTVIVAPTATTSLTAAKKARRDVTSGGELHPQFATAAAEADKRKRYAIFTPNEGVSIVPFPMDVYGGVGASSYQYLRSVLVTQGDPKLPEHRRAANVTRTVQMLNVALARGLHARVIASTNPNDPRVHKLRSVRKTFSKQSLYSAKKQFAAVRAAAKAGYPAPAAASAASSSQSVTPQQPTSSLPATTAVPAAAPHASASAAPAPAHTSAKAKTTTKTKTKSSAKSQAKSKPAPKTSSSASTKTAGPAGTTSETSTQLPTNPAVAAAASTAPAPRAKASRPSVQPTLQTWMSSHTASRRSVTPASSSGSSNSVVELDGASAVTHGRRAGSRSSMEDDE